MAVTMHAVRASNGARDWPREVAGQADHLQPCGDRGRLRRWTASERRSRRRFNLDAKGLSNAQSVAEPCCSMAVEAPTAVTMQE